MLKYIWPPSFFEMWNRRRGEGEKPEGIWAMTVYFIALMALSHNWYQGEQAELRSGHFIGCMAMASCIAELSQTIYEVWG